MLFVKEKTIKVGPKHKPANQDLHVRQVAAPWASLNSHLTSLGLLKVVVDLLPVHHIPPGRDVARPRGLVPAPVSLLIRMLIYVAGAV